jgi:hypothetical protein
MYFSPFFFRMTQRAGKRPFQTTEMVARPGSGQLRRA